MEAAGRRVKRIQRASRVGRKQRSVGVYQRAVGRNVYSYSESQTRKASKSTHVDPVLMDAYYDPKHPGSFAGATSFQRHVNGSFKNKDVKTWLSEQDAYTLHKPIRLVFRRRKTFTVGINDLWQADLVDLSALAKFNDKYKYILTCIDVFSKYAWALPLKSKTGVDLTEAFSSLLVDRHPAHLQTDKGTEFLNKNFQSMLRANEIRFYTTENN